MDDDNLPPFTINCNDIGEGTSLAVVWNMYLRTLAILNQTSSIEIPPGEDVAEYLTEKARTILIKSANIVKGNRDENAPLDEDYLFEHALKNCSYMLENMTGDPYERLSDQG